MDIGSGFLVGYLIAAVVFGIIAMAIADARGLSKNSYFVVGFLLGVIGIILAAVMSAPGANVRAGDIVKITSPVQLKDGTKIRVGHTSKVHDMDVVEGTPAVEIDGPTGLRHWVAKSQVRGV